MQNQQDVEKELARLKEGLELQNLRVNPQRTREENERYKKLLQAELANLELQPVLGQEADDSTDVSLISDFSQEMEPEKLVSRTRKVPTVAAQVTKNLNPGTVSVKREMNNTYPQNKLGSQHTPVKMVGKDITNNTFFLSPKGTTATYEQTVRVSVKKVSGEQFIPADSTEDSSISKSFGS